MNKENKLGMGLGALLSTSNDKNENKNGIQKINISQIIPKRKLVEKNRITVNRIIFEKICNFFAKFLILNYTFIKSIIKN